MTDYIKYCLLFMMGTWLAKVFIKPTVSHYPILNEVINVISAIALVYIVVSWIMQFRDQLQGMEPAQRRRYLQRNGVLALILIGFWSFIVWRLYSLKP